MGFWKIKHTGRKDLFMLPFRRDYNAKRINRVVNDPSVLPEVALPGQENIDLSQLVSDLRNIVLMCDEGGIVAHWREQGIYEIHTQFTSKYRGIGAVRTVREMVSWLFLNSPAMELQTKIPEVNKSAHGLVQAINGRLEFDRQDVWPLADGKFCSMDYYALRYSDWLYSPWAAGKLAARGEWFHQKLDAAKSAFLAPPDEHGHDAAHDVNVGATIEMIFADQTEKALTLYNRWSRFAGYAEVRLISLAPLVIDIQDAVLLIDCKVQDFEVLAVRPQPPAAVPLEEEEAA